MQFIDVVFLMSPRGNVELLFPGENFSVHLLT